MSFIQPCIDLSKAFFAHLGADAASTLQRYLILAYPLLDSYGYLAIFAAILIEGIGIPAPGQTLLMAGSILSARGKMSLAAVFTLSLLACVLGNTCGYAIGRWGSRRLLPKFRINDTRLRKMERLFDRYGGGVVFVFSYCRTLYDPYNDGSGRHAGEVSGPPSQAS